MTMTGMARRFCAGLALAAFVAWPLASAQTSIDLQQNWSLQDRKNWHEATQGSRLIPYSWLEALEQADGTNLFLAADNIEKYRYLSVDDAGLPIGFALDNSDDSQLSMTKLRWKSGQESAEPWVGFNCSACHTAGMTYKGQTLTIEGGPSRTDFQGFMEALDLALVRTRDDPTKFARFAQKVLGADDDPLNRESLKGALAQLVAWQNKLERMNATDLRYGFGRLDAIGHIFNKVALIADPDKLVPNPSDAPVKYPMLWNAPQLDKVQWNAFAANTPLPSVGQPFDIGALGRNTGEVVGVFGDIIPTADAGLKGYVSSVQIASLVSMEQLLGTLRPPKWPDIFGAPNPDMVVKGAALFQQRCVGCHDGLAREDLETRIKVRIQLFNGADENPTDPWMACNAYLRHAPTGVLQGTRRDYLKGSRLGPDEPLRDMLNATVEGTLAGDKDAILFSMNQSFFGRQPPPLVVSPPAPQPRVAMAARACALGEAHIRSPEKQMQLDQCMKDTFEFLGYKSRPLSGIWAAAPYLHNGSVPTLRALLSPAERRPRTFSVGTREFDPVNVGYVTDPAAPGNSFLFEAADKCGQPIDGNWNTGHDYDNATLSPADVDDLIEYLKTL